MIVFDIDGTLSIVGDRIKYIQKQPPDWDSFFNNCYKDKVNEPIAKICRSLMINNIIIFVTGRKESTRQMTMNWLNKHNLWQNGSKLLMRSNNDQRHDTEIKPELIKKYIPSIEMVFEDRNSVVQMWRKMGITCLQVNDGKF